MSATMEALRANVVRKRAQQQLSQADLAKRAAIARATVTKIESGDGNVTIESLEKIAGVLRCNVHQLFAARAARANGTELERRAASDRKDFVDAFALLDAVDEANEVRYSKAGRKRKTLVG
jgi:transcriptional regulator with XRE-family HTH domain